MIKTFSEAQEFIYKHIDADPKKRFAGEFGLRRGAYLLKLIGNPQNKLRVIHVAGTSGKGSTAFYTSKLLQAMGFKVGLTISPHLVDIRERCQINNRMISQEEFISALNRLLPAINKMKTSSFHGTSYFEILTALFFYVADKNKVDYAVVETGLGGLYDGTNVVTRRDKLCLISKIGLDHTEILGDTLSKIALQKAGIIQNGNKLISLFQNREVNQVFQKKIREKHGKLFLLKDGINYSNICLRNNLVSFDFKFTQFVLDKITLDTPALYQVENCSLALAATTFLSERDAFKIDENKIKNILGNIHFPGRMEVFKIQNKTLIIDGAHNPQKMASFLESLKNISTKKLSFMTAFRKGKNFQKMIDEIMPLASKIILTSFVTTDMDLAHSSESARDVARYLEKRMFKDYLIVPDNKKALETLLKQKEKYLVITGSLYLLSAVYSYL